MRLPASRFFDTLDAAQHHGAKQLKSAFLERHFQFIRSFQAPHGGFRGRRGPADPYYTDFALRTLGLRPPVDFDGTLPSTALATWFRAEPLDLVTLFNLLNSRRLLRARGVETPLDPGPLLRFLSVQQLPHGGFRRSKGNSIAAFNSLLGALSLGLLDAETVAFPVAAAEALIGLRTSDGGFRESNQACLAEANATAAVLVFLHLSGGLECGVREEAIGFLQKLQASSGGICAHTTAPCADLLSSYSTLAALYLLDSPAALNLTALARFIRTLSLSPGGFGACEADLEPDIEYTYYALASLSLLHKIALQPSVETAG